MRLAQTILAATILAISETHEIAKRSSGGEKRVVCYYTNWSVYRPGTAKFNPQNINPYLCTHLIYAFGGLDRENGLRPYDKYQDIEQGGYAKFTGLKTYNKQLKTLLAIGGWNEGSARFSPLVADEERRREFVKNVIKFLRQNHFDGLDLDWEYPAYRDGGKPRDRDNYAQLVQELREEFEKESSKTGRPRLLLTMAVPAGIEYIDKGYDIPKLNRYLDFMNILSYDYHSAFEPSVNHHSPLYSLEEDSEYNFDSQLTIDATVKHYLMKGADAEKLVLGIPTYGRSYTLFNPDSTDMGSPADGPGEQGEATREKGYLAYYEICNNIKDGWTVIQPKESAMGPYAYKGNQWVGYDDEAIVKKKSQYVNEKNLGGIMFWSIDNDDFRGKCHSRPYPLIEAAKEALLGKGGVSNKLPSGPRGGKTSKTGKPKPTPRSTTTPTPPSATVTTPEPPTTPDPGSDFVCKDEGFFPHPRDCKKYFWCLDSGPSDLGIVAHQFTCPSGLYFNKAADSCDFSRNVICKKKSGTATTTTTTTTAAPKTSKSSYGKITLPPKTTTTTTTTTTTPAPIEEEIEEDDEDYKEEDPQTIKQLIQLIKKLGGVAELEKQLEGSSGSGVDSTTPAISKSLYERVISSGSPRYQTIQRNGPGPQNEGLPRERSSFRREKPQYVTIKRDRPSTTTESTEIVYAVEEEVDDIEEEAPKYKTISRNRESQFSFNNENEKPERPKYQSSERFRPKVRTEEAPEKSTTLKYTSILRSRAPTSDATATTSKYVVLQRQRTTNQQPADVGTTENELNDEEEVTEHVIETTTSRPRVKVSDIVPTTMSIPTSTRVVTEIVEGATQRQRVPLSKLRYFLKDLDNSVIEPVTQESKPSTTEDIQTERPLLHGFNRRRPEIIVTTTVRTTPAFLSNRRNRIRSTTEPIEVSTRGRFVPSRSRGRPNEVNKGEHRFTPLHHDSEPQENIDQKQSNTSDPSVSTTEDKVTPRNRFSFRRRTTKKPESNEEDEVFVRTSSRDSNIIRKPVYKPRFPSRRRSTTPESIPEAIVSPTTEHNQISSESSFLTNSTLEANSALPTASSPMSSGTSYPTTEILPTTTAQFFIGESEIASTDKTFLDPDNYNKTHAKEIITTPPSDKIDVNPSNNTSSNNNSEVNLVAPTQEAVALEEERSGITSLPISDTTEDSTDRITLKAKEKSSETSTLKTANMTRFKLRLNHGRNFINSRNSKNSLDINNNPREVPQQERDVKKKIILRRKKLTSESNYIADVPEREYKSNRTSVIRRKRPLTEETGIDSEKNLTRTNDPSKNVHRGKIRFFSQAQNKSSSSYEDSVASPSKDTSRTRSRLVNKPNSSPDPLTTDINPTPIKHKRIIIRGRKKYNLTETDTLKENNSIKQTRIDLEDRQPTEPNLSTTLNKTEIEHKFRNKVRKVILRKPVKDLVVEESMSPGMGGSFENSSLNRKSSINDASSSLSNGDLDIDFSEDIIHTSNGEQEIQTRSRRPFRKTVARTTTTTTTEAPTTTRQRTTAQSLRQRLNRFKSERKIPKASTSPNVKDQEPEFEPTSQRPVVRKEFRRLIKPVHVDDSQLDASHIRQNTPQNEIRSPKPHKQFLEQVTEGSQVSEEYTDEEPLVLPDLANVAVAAIQSLATSPPPTTTEQYKSTLRHKSNRPVKVVQRRPSRPTFAPAPARSSPRPFSKVNYDDYEDYYAEPVEVPLSGKVRIHNDGYIECLDIGNFPHPFSCRKFISCAKMENSHILGWEYTCPKGLSFDPIGGICNWNAGLGCKE